MIYALAQSKGASDFEALTVLATGHGTKASVRRCRPHELATSGPEIAQFIHNPDRGGGFVIVSRSRPGYFWVVDGGYLIIREQTEDDVRRLWSGYAMSITAPGALDSSDLLKGMAGVGLNVASICFACKAIPRPARRVISD
jgi:hypothetical protein